MEFDPVLHQPVRTKIIALLLREGECDYTFIKETSNITDGHMSTHMRTLVESKYVEAKKEFVNNKPKTTYRLSHLGRKKFKAYVDQLSEIVAWSKK